MALQVVLTEDEIENIIEALEKQKIDQRIRDNNLIIYLKRKLKE
jgi:hypothetical protein